MKQWTRKTALGGPRPTQNTEVWECRDEGRPVASYEVDVTLGKPLDVLNLKGTSLQEIRDYAAFLQQTATHLYAPHQPRRIVRQCPCCTADTATALETLVVYKIPYHRCTHCGHLFVRSQPAIEIMAKVFAESEELSAVYTDKKSIETRLAQVVQPKLDWVRNVYRRHYGRESNCVLDVGAGGGHFVEVCRRAELSASGYEISKSSRQFAKEVFNIELIGTDFLTLKKSTSEIDVLTFWGLLEYTPEPRRFLETARRQLDPRNGMLIVEVPRYDCLGSAIQKECPEIVARHLDPTSHVNCFSDTSLVMALHATGFRPIAAWYFGMDAYEMIVQLALRFGNDQLVGQVAPLIPGLQKALDAVQCCDDIIVAALPVD